MQRVDPRQAGVIVEDLGQDRGDIGAGRGHPGIHLVFGDPGAADAPPLPAHFAPLPSSASDRLRFFIALLRFLRTAASESPSSPAISASLNPSQCQAMTCRCLGGRPAITAARNSPGVGLLFQGQRG